MPEKKIEVEFAYEKTTANYHMFKKSRKVAPGFLPDKIYIDKEDLTEDPTGIKITIEETR